MTASDALGVSIVLTALGVSIVGAAPIAMVASIALIASIAGIATIVSVAAVAVTAAVAASAVIASAAAIATLIKLCRYNIQRQKSDQETTTPVFIMTENHFKWCVAALGETWKRLKKLF